MSEFFSYFWFVLLGGGAALVICLPCIVFLCWLVEKFGHSLWALFLVVAITVVYAAAVVAAFYTLAS